MQHLRFSYPADRVMTQPVHVGVVASGDLEIVLRPTSALVADIDVRTSIDGFDAVWRRVLDRFFETGALRARYEINDFGATPGMVSLRLAQALELVDEADRA